MRHRCGVNTKVVQQIERREHQGIRQYLELGTAAVLIGLSVSAGAIQSPSNAAPVHRRTAQNKAVPSAEQPSKTAGDPDLASLQDALKNPELMVEFGRLVEKLQKGVQYPAARNQSRILARLPASTVFFVAFPNYGEPAHQALQIFDQELKDSAQLRDFLHKNNLDAMQPQVENGIEKFYEFSQFLGDEVVITGKLQGKEPTGVLVAEVKKPGLREFLEKLNDEVFTSKSDRLRIFNPQQLAAAGEQDASQAPAVLVRSDFVGIGLNVSALREFNSQIEQGGPAFTSNALGQRLAQAYQQRGVNSLVGLDLHRLIGLIPLSKPQDRIMLEKTGFADVNYLVTENTMSAEKSANTGEVTFNGPRRGIASWIAAPAPLGGLDFVSTHAAMAGDVMLKSPAQIFDDLRDIMGEAAFANLPQMEAQFKVNLKRDVLGKLNGEIAFEIKSPPIPPQAMPPSTFVGAAAPSPNPGAFKFILRVSDPDGLRQTLTRLLATAPVQGGQREEDGVIFHTVTLPGPAGPPTEINYFFLDGYLVIASDRATAREALRVHRGGDSLAKSSQLRDSLVSGQPREASMIFYQNAGQMLGAMMGQLPPELRQLIPVSGAIAAKPTVFSVYADECVLRGVTTSNMQADISVPLIVAAIAIPNLLRSRVAANESAAAAGVRVVNTAQVTYSASYPAKGYARDLASLGPGSGGDCAGSNATEEHACLLDATLANAGCTAGKWCEKSGYKFSVRGVCMQAQCLNYTVTATPVNANTGGKSFCSTSDAVVRSHSGAPLTAPLTVTECGTWTPVR